MTNWKLKIVNSVSKYSKAHKQNINYGTAGFRTLAENLDHVMYRMGILAALYSQYRHKITGIMITASHNPECDNGVKIIGPYGEMLEESWEPLASQLANADDLSLIRIIEHSIIEPMGLVNTTTHQSIVFIGHDTRESCKHLVEASIAGIKCMGGKYINYGLVTTPQLHYLIAVGNKRFIYEDMFDTVVIEQKNDSSKQEDIHIKNYDNCTLEKFDNINKNNCDKIIYPTEPEYYVRLVSAFLSFVLQNQNQGQEQTTIEHCGDCGQDSTNQTAMDTLSNIPLTLYCDTAFGVGGPKLLELISHYLYSFETDTDTSIIKHVNHPLASLVDRYGPLALYETYEHVMAKRMEARERNWRYDTTAKTADGHQLMIATDGSELPKVVTDDDDNDENKKDNLDFAFIRNGGHLHKIKSLVDIKVFNVIANCLNNHKMDCNDGLKNGVFSNGVSITHHNTDHVNKNASERDAANQEQNEIKLESSKIDDEILKKFIIDSRFTCETNGYSETDKFSKENYGKLNEMCGADYVKVNQKPPIGIPLFSNSPKLNNAPILYASLDGDGDRIVFYYFTDLEVTSKTKETSFRLLDGDKIAALIAFYLKNALTDCGLNLADFSVGIVQTAYANGSSTAYYKSQGLDVYFTPTGVKHLHHQAAKMDIGIYFEANGHGTVLYSDNLTKRIRNIAHHEPDTVVSNERRFAAQELLYFIQMTNQFVGDALSDLLLVLAIMLKKGVNVKQWDALYTDYPSRQLKVKVKDRTFIKTSWDETQCIKPAGLQTELDEIVKGYERGRAFIRPSGTEDVIRVYAEGPTQDQLELFKDTLEMQMEDTDTLAQQIVQLVQKYDDQN